jgi:hypothetical protein
MVVIIMAKVNHWRWYVVGSKAGKKWLLGGYQTEEEADDRAWDFFQELPYTKHHIKTIDRNQASRMLRHKFLQDNEEFEYIVQPFHRVKPT